VTADNQAEFFLFLDLSTNTIVHAYSYDKDQYQLYRSIFDYNNGFLFFGFQSSRFATDGITYTYYDFSYPNAIDFRTDASLYLIAPTSSYTQNTAAIAAATSHPVTNGPLASASFVNNNVIYCEVTPHCIVDNVCGNGQ